nr:hypothetical protein DA06_13425 [Georgenia sp. SUBG003]
MGAAEVLEELLVGGRLLERVQVRTMKVLEQRVTEELTVLRLPDDGRHGVVPCPLGSAPPPFAHDQLVLRAVR